MTFRFPNVSFDTTIISPRPIVSDWRNTIGIAGVFSRGPLLATINEPYDFYRYYGYDNSPGAQLVKDAMLQGATSFVISRAVGQAEKAGYNLKFTSKVAGLDPRVGYKGEAPLFDANGQPSATTGLKLGFEYVGDAILDPQIGESYLKSYTASQISPKLEFNGAASAAFFVEDYIKAPDQIYLNSNITRSSKKFVYGLYPFLLEDQQSLLTLEDSDPLLLAPLPPPANLAIGDTGVIDTELPLFPFDKIYDTLTQDLILQFSGGVRLRITDNGENYLVLRAGEIYPGEIAYEPIPVSFKAPLDGIPSGSELWAGGIGGTKLVILENVDATSGIITADVGVELSENSIGVSAGTFLYSSFKLAECAADIYATTNLISNQIEEPIQYIFIDGLDEYNLSFLNQAKPGLYIGANDATVNFYPNYLQIIGYPEADETRIGYKRLAVKGSITNTRRPGYIKLLQAPISYYILGFNLSYLPSNLLTLGKKIYDPFEVVVVNATNAGNLVALQVTNLAEDIDPGAEIAFNTAKFIVRRFATKSTSSVTLYGDLSSDIAAGQTGVLSDNVLYTRWNDRFNQIQTGSKADSFIVVSEVFRERNLNPFLYFDRFLVGKGLSPQIEAVKLGLDLEIIQFKLTGRVSLDLASVYRIPIAKTQVSIGSYNTQPFSVGLRSSEVLNQLVAAINSNPIAKLLIGDFSENYSFLPPNLDLITSFEGQTGNRINLTVSREVQGTIDQVPDLNFPYGIKQTFKGGKDQAQAAYIKFYTDAGEPLVKIQAASAGAFGNGLTVNFLSFKPGQFTIEVADKSSSAGSSSVSEVLILDNRQIQASGLYEASTDSNLVRVYHLPIAKGKTLTEAELDIVPARVFPNYSYRFDFPIGLNKVDPELDYFALGFSGPAALVGAEFKLKHGTDGQVSADELFQVLKKAVDRLADQDIAFLCCAGLDTTSFSANPAVEAILTQVNQAAEQGPRVGVRRAVLPAPPFASASQAAKLARTLNNPRVTLVAGQQTIFGDRKTSGVGIYAGYVASQPPYNSPAATTERFPQGITATTAKNTPSELNIYSQNGVEALIYDRTIEAFKFLNGLSTTSDYANRYVSVLQVEDQIKSDLYETLSYLKSEQNNASLWKKASAACDTYLSNLVQKGWIASFRNTICDSSNNTGLTVSEGKLNITLIYTPVYPADYIQVTLTREIVSGLSVTI